MSLKTIAPAEAKRLLESGAVLIDVRGRDEHAREHIAGARNQPVGQIERVESGGAPILFHCKSGNRTAANASKLGAAANGCEAYVVAGGIEAWKAAGLPVQADASRPIEIMRQVQIVAGGLVLLGVLLGTMVAPGFLGLAAFVGAGLMFAGITGWCGMAKLLAVLPWNRPKPATA